MALHRVRIRLRAPLGTPLHSGTLFGHLCWAKRETEGEATLRDWLDALPSSPWMLSDGFPADRLPKPLLKPSRPERLKTTDVKTLEEGKERKRWEWIALDDWRTLRAALDDAKLRDNVKDHEPLDNRTAHNAIDRHTGSTPEEGGLYFVDEDWSFARDDRRDIYVRAPASADEIEALFRIVGEAGYGRDATWGRGVFTVESVEPVAWLDEVDGNRMMSLSHGALSDNMGDPRYRLETHFGKLGVGMLGRTDRPWKRPLLLTRPGCTFTPAGKGPFGRWLAGDVHQTLGEVCHNAFHLAIPFRETEAAS